MLSKEELKKQPEYWIEVIQNTIFNALHEYMKNENINQSQLAKQMGVSKGYISQVLNGNFNFSLKKLVELSITIGMYPNLDFVPFKEDKAFSHSSSNKSATTKTKISKGRRVNKKSILG